MGSASPAPPLPHYRPQAAARPPRLGSARHSRRWGRSPYWALPQGPPLTCGCRGRLGACPRSGRMGRRADPARPGPAAAPPPPSSSLPRMRAPDAAAAAIPRGRAPTPRAPALGVRRPRPISARAPARACPPHPPARAPPPLDGPPLTSREGEVGRGRSVLPPPGAPRPGLPRSPHPPTRHRGLGAAAPHLHRRRRQWAVGTGRDGTGRPRSLAHRSPPPTPTPGRPRACERRRSGRQQNGVGQALRPGGAPGRRQSPCTARHRSRPRCPRAVSGASGAVRRPPPLGSGYPLPLSAAPRGPARRPRRAPPPPSRAPAGRAVALRGAAVQNRGSLAEPRPPGSGAGCPRPGCPRRAPPLLDSRAPTRPPAAERRAPAPRPPAPPGWAATAAPRNRPAAGDGSVATSDAGRGLRRQPHGSGRRAAPPHRHGWAGTERGAAGAARGCGTGAVLPGPCGGQGRAAAPRDAAAELAAALPGRTRSPRPPLPFVFPPPPLPPRPGRAGAPGRSGAALPPPG
ncbi:basic proline-rich protein-like [Cinclus cinclus]|uniref:basic proline-rich protein-like n=1 Tax=Cinclus cinclus TaxID=127875 RepID=UPI002E14A99F